MRYNIISLIILTAINCFCMESPLSPSILNRELAAALLALGERAQANNSEILPKKNEYKCHECGSEFQSKHTFQFHAGRAHPFECDQCHLSFVGNIYLKTHKFDVHGELDTNKCFICNKTFVYLQKHMRTHTSNNTIENNASSLEKNCLDIEEYRDKLRPYFCKECGLSFKRSSNLTRHRMKKHGISSYSSP